MGRTIRPTRTPHPPKRLEPGAMARIIGELFCHEAEDQRTTEQIPIGWVFSERPCERQVGLVPQHGVRNHNGDGPTSWTKVRRDVQNDRDTRRVEEDIPAEIAVHEVLDRGPRPTQHRRIPDLEASPLERRGACFDLPVGLGQRWPSGACGTKARRIRPAGHRSASAKRRPTSAICAHRGAAGRRPWIRREADHASCNHFPSTVGTGRAIR